MKKRLFSAALLFTTALIPPPVSAQNVFGIDFSDVTLTAFVSAATQLDPIKTDSDTATAPRTTASNVEALVLARGIGFPNLPNSVGSSFASAAGDNNGVIGVGVNGFFFTNSLPPDALLASGTFSQTFTNNSASTVSIFADVVIPAPTILFFGVGDFFPTGADPRRDAAASVNASFLAKLTRADGSIVETTPLDYGISVFRNPISGVLSAIDADGALLSRFVEPDGSFGFQLPTFTGQNIKVGEIEPGDILEFTFDYFASASTGFGETGIFAAIGDPFNLSTDAGHLEISAAVVPEPASWMLFVAGLLAIWLGVRARVPRRFDYVLVKTARRDSRGAAPI